MAGENGAGRFPHRSLREDLGGTIVKALRKLQTNFLSRRAVSVLGPRLYCRYLAHFVGNLPRILAGGDLRPLDKAMGAVARRFRHRGHSFSFDCRFCDQELREESFAFGIAREIYIRDCYFKWQPPAVYERAKTVVDVGANRGAFSALMTTRAEFILCVECGEQYAPIIRHNMEANHFTRYAVETAFVGAGGAVAASGAPQIAIDELFRRHRIEAVDFLKLDIEGSEFGLFESADWLRRVRALSMEVHPRHGDPRAILDRLAAEGFTCAAADDNLRRVASAEQAGFIYAWKDV
jgi:hypothetical protein